MMTSAENSKDAGNLTKLYRSDEKNYVEEEELSLDFLSLLETELDIDSSRCYSQENETFFSKNVLRKQRHWEKILAAKKCKRKQEKEKRKAKASENNSQGTIKERHSKRFLKELTMERLLTAKYSGPKLCIDLSMTEHMTKKEISRLAAQIRRLYGSNRKTAKPFWVYLTGFLENSLLYDECVRMNDGFNNYLVDTTESNFLDIFPLEQVVYLTPDSNSALEDIDPQKVYVLGGLVDESIQKKLTYRKAKEHGLQTARLPIQEYMDKKVNSKNFHSEILAINQVFDVLSTYYRTKSWPEALQTGVSSGKGYVLRDNATMETY
ncbi:hypothetical protein GDO86_001321 [Hymenochirus boettgeri]|uniref:tRNA methyltransferase 10 homolog B n=1 Tax=Hymenochirus boettgeri TaxID=247094 RepID=A0A8T2KC73_9PIPI|nr:hypothetical protein GDO86_001321 [Hymenochirus boettgeri]